MQALDDARGCKNAASSSMLTNGALAKQSQKIQISCDITDI